MENTKNRAIKSASKTAKKFKHGEPRDKEAGPSRAKIGSQTENFGVNTIPFNVHTPLWTSSIKFEPLRKKDQSADTNTPPEIKKFWPYPLEKTRRSKDADAHNPSEMAFSNPLRNSRP
jgi:hypothetical protein